MLRLALLCRYTTPSLSPGPALSASSTRSGHLPRKRFGQHFLTDAGVIDAIVGAIHPQAGDLMAEIGPGLGALTAPLLRHLKRLHAIEIDRDVIARLQKTFPAEKLLIHAGDALAFDFSRVVEEESYDTVGGSGSPAIGAAAPAVAPVLRVVGNLPYNISTPLLFHLADFSHLIIDCHFMLQKEVVQRMVATPGNKAFGRLSVMLQYRFAMESVLDVPPDAFDPPPKVESAVVRMIPKPAAERAARDEHLLGEIVTQAFGQRRKTLRNTLKGRVSDGQFAQAAIDPGARAEEIDVERYVALANLLAAP